MKRRSHNGFCAFDLEYSSHLTPAALSKLISVHRCPGSLAPKPSRHTDFLLVSFMCQVFLLLSPSECSFPLFMTGFFKTYVVYVFWTFLPTSFDNKNTNLHWEDELATLRLWGCRGRGQILSRKPKPHDLATATVIGSKIDMWLMTGQSGPAPEVTLEPMRKRHSFTSLPPFFPFSLHLPLSVFLCVFLNFTLSPSPSLPFFLSFNWFEFTFCHLQTKYYGLMSFLKGDTSEYNI